MNKLEHIGARIRLFRKHQNLTLEELAYMVHKSPSTICKYENGSVNLREEFFKRGVLVIDGYDFKGLDSSAARVRMPRLEEFPKLLSAITEINELN